LSFSENPTSGTDEFIKGLWRENPVFVQVLGMCPVLAVTNTARNALAMGLATMFVLVMSNLAISSIRHWIPKQVRIATFILVIASLVQMVEIMLKKVSPPLYQALGIFLPLITTNCAVLGVAVLAVQTDYNLLESVVFAIANAVGFGIAIVVFAGLREHLELLNVPKAMRGVPIAFIVAGLLALAFLGFSGIV